MFLLHSNNQKVLNKFDIPTRSSGHNSGLTRRYGYKNIKGQILEHKVEQRVVVSIIKMRQEGLSFQAIARVLDSMKVSTKKRGKGWHKEMVRKIYLREQGK